MIQNSFQGIAFGTSDLKSWVLEPSETDAMLKYVRLLSKCSELRCHGGMKCEKNSVSAVASSFALPLHRGSVVWG